MEVMSDEEEEKQPQSPAVSPIQVKHGRAAPPTAGFVSPGLVTFKVAVFSLLAIPLCYALRNTELVNEPNYLMITGFVTLVAVLTVADRAIFSNMPFKQYDLFMVRLERPAETSLTFLRPLLWLTFQHFFANRCFLQCAPLPASLISSWP